MPLQHSLRWAALIYVLALCDLISIESGLLVRHCLADIHIASEQYQHACGPISCLVALRSLGLSSSLDALRDDCNWQEGEGVRFSDMQNALQSYRGIDCESVRLNSQQLLALLLDSRTVVILATRRDSDRINHAVCAVSANKEENSIRICDYPELNQEIGIDEIGDTWDGAALVVRVSPLYRTLADFTLIFVPIAALIVSYCCFSSSQLVRAKKHAG